MDAAVSLQEWWPWYNRIAEEFGYDPGKDQLAADILSRLISQNSIDPRFLKDIISDKPVLVFGAGPSLEEDLQRLAELGLLGKFVIVSADGATTALLKVAKVTPEVVVSDLDGNLKDLFHANRLGSVMVIHGHGDNINRLKRYVPRFEKVIGTTQVEPRPNVYNFGGFTDGDRAVFLAIAMEAKLVVLAGMDLGRTVGKYSKRRVKSVHTKILKLKICKELLEWLASRVKFPLYNVTAHGERIKGFTDITPSELARIMG